MLFGLLGHKMTNGTKLLQRRQVVTLVTTVENQSISLIEKNCWRCPNTRTARFDAPEITLLN
jgi:hypothetical protein